MNPIRRFPSGKTSNKHKFLKFIFLVAAAAGIFFWYQYSKYQYFIETPVDPSNSTGQTFIIKKGQNLNEIAKNLEDGALILDSEALKTYAKWSGNDRKIIAGRFILSKDMTIPEVVEAITNTRKSEAVLTVPEGSTVGDIDTTLAELGMIEEGEFIKAVNEFDKWEEYPFLDRETSATLVHPLEGYLFPDTYFLDPLNFYSENLIQLMLDNFENKLGDELYKDHNGKSLQDIIIMASIVEKEVRTNKDIPVVAGILWKRLDSGWLLGADATLLYLKEDRTIDYADIKEDTPYNTRINAGLPPGPICNPGLESITAALNPEDSPYWYYLTTLDTGEVIYATTNDEHNANKRKYL